MTDEEADTELFRRVQEAQEEVISLLLVNPDNGAPARFAARRIALADMKRFGASDRPTLRG